MKYDVRVRSCDWTPCASQPPLQNWDRVPLFLHVDRSDPVWWRILSVIFDCLGQLAIWCHTHHDLEPVKLPIRAIDYRFRLRGLGGIVHDRRGESRFGHGRAHNYGKDDHLLGWFALLAGFYLPWFGIGDSWETMTQLQRRRFKILGAVGLTMMLWGGLELYHGLVTMACWPSQLYRYFSPPVDQEAVEKLIVEKWQREIRLVLADHLDGCEDLCTLLLSYNSMEPFSLTHTLAQKIEGLHERTPYSRAEHLKRARRKRQFKFIYHPGYDGAPFTADCKCGECLNYLDWRLWCFKI